jgi:hypothetical protein
MATIISSCLVHCRIETLHELSHAWLAVFDNHFDKNSIQSEAGDPNDATAKRDLGSLASPSVHSEWKQQTVRTAPPPLADQDQNPPRRLITYPMWICSRSLEMS